MRESLPLRSTDAIARQSRVMGLQDIPAPGRATATSRVGPGAPPYPLILKSMQWVRRTHLPTAPHSERFLPIGTAGKTRRGTSPLPPPPPGHPPSVAHGVLELVKTDEPRHHLGEAVVVEIAKSCRFLLNQSSGNPNRE